MKSKKQRKQRKQLTNFKLINQDLKREFGIVMLAEDIIDEMAFSEYQLVEDE